MKELNYYEREHLSVSTLLDFAKCPRSYFYAKCGLRSPDGVPAPEFGSAMHAAIPVALETEDLIKALTAFQTVWQPTQDRLDAAGDEDPKRNSTRAYKILEHFINERKGRKALYELLEPPPTTIPREGGASRYEVPWTVDIGLRVPLVGWFDGFCRHRDTGERYIWELKTTSKTLSGWFFAAHEMSPQNLVYGGVSSTITEDPITGVMIEGVRVDKTKLDCVTHPIPLLPHHIQDGMRWAQATGAALLACESKFIELVQEGRDFVEAADLCWTKNFAGCTPYPWYYYPGFRCDYDDLCRAGDFRDVVGMYNIVEDHKFLLATVEGQPVD